MSSILNLIGRTKELFVDDIKNFEKELSDVVSTFLVIGGAGQKKSLNFMLLIYQKIIWLN